MDTRVQIVIFIANGVLPRDQLSQYQLPLDQPPMRSTQCNNWTDLSKYIKKCTRIQISIFQKPYLSVPPFIEEAEMLWLQTEEIFPHIFFICET